MDLGNITFGFAADTTGLKRALDALRDLSRHVNLVAKANDEEAQKTLNAWARQEKAAAGAFTRITSLQKAMRELGMSSTALGAPTRALNTLIEALASGKLEVHEFNRALAYINEQVAQNTRGMKAFKAEQDKLLGTYQAQSRAAQRIADLNAKINASGVGESTEMVRKITEAQAKYNAVLEKGNVTRWERKRAEVDLNNVLREQQRILTAHLQVGTAADKKARELEMLRRQQSRTLRTARQVGVPGTAQEQLSGAFRELERVWSSGTLDQRKQATDRFNASLDRLKEKINQVGTSSQRMAGIFRGMERATVLATGPLSGFGSRLAVLSALVESVGLKSAMLIASMTAITASLTLMGFASVRARMEMEKLNGLLLAATGAHVLVGKEMEYVTDISLKLGQNVRTLAPSFASFATSARLSGMTLKETRNTFEAFAEAGTALRLSEEQMGRVFLALEQMMSKGTVQSQELKIQLGQVLPGAFELAAFAMGKTQREFAKMLEQGQIATNEFLPKFAAKIREVFGPSTLEGMTSIQAELGRFGTAFFKASIAMDDAVRFSQGFRIALITLTKVISFVADNIDRIVGSVLALAGGLITLQTASFLAAGGLGRVADTLKKVAAAILGFNAAFMAGPLRWLDILLRLATALTVGTVLYKYFTDETGKAAEKTQQLTETVEKTLAVFERMKEIPKDVAENTRKAIIDEITARQLGLQALMAEYQARLVLEKKREGWLKKATQAGPMISIPVLGAVNIWDWLWDNKRPKEIEGEMAEVEKALAKLWSALDRLGAIPTTSPVTQRLDQDSKAVKNYKERLDELLRTYVMTVSETEALQAGMGVAGVEALQGQLDAFKLLNDQPEKFAGEAKKFIAEANRMGIEGNDLGVVVMNLSERLRESKRVLKEVTEAMIEDPKRGYEELAAIQQDLANRFALATEETGFFYQAQKKGLGDVEKLQKALEKVKKDMDPEKFKAFAEAWQKTTDTVLKSELGQTVAKELSRIRTALGDFGTGEGDKFADMVKFLNDLALKFPDLAEQLLGANWPQKIQELIGKAQIASADKMKAGAKDLFDEVNRLVDEWANQTEDAIVRVIETGRLEWRELVKDMFSSFIRLFTREMIVNPLFDAAFGNRDDQGKRSGGIISLLVEAFRAGFSGTSADWTSGFDIGGRQMGGTFSANRPILVGERGPEVIVPGTPGTVIPTDKLSRGGGGVVNNVSITVNITGDGQQTGRAVKESSAREAGNELGRKVDAAVRGVLIQELRPGGLLAR